MKRTPVQEIGECWECKKKKKIIARQLCGSCYNQYIKKKKKKKMPPQKGTQYRKKYTKEKIKKICNDLIDPDELNAGRSQGTISLPRVRDRF